MRLEERIESYLQSSSDMMIPGGYVSPTLKQAKGLLEGKDMKTYLDISGYDTTVSTEELSTQNVVNAKWDGVVCHMFTDYVQKREPEPLTPG